MKKSLFLFLLGCCLTLSAKAQGFEINPSFYDSLGPTGYSMHFTGHAVFNDSMQVYYSVKSNDSVPQLLLIDSVDFTIASPAFPAGFSYNADSSFVSISFGDYPTKELILELYSIIAGETREHIYVNIHNFEIALEDEE